MSAMSENVIIENSSGHGPGADVPREIIWWNWGACILNLVWGIRNKTYIVFLCVIPIVGFVMMIVLGMKGNEWAWQHKRWESIEKFQHEQKAWSRWGLRIGAVLLALGILGLILNPIMSLLEMLQDR